MQRGLKFFLFVCLTNDAQPDPDAVIPELLEELTMVLLDYESSIHG
jgi:hypothetical protein